ncbi:Oxoglutarate and iron-dependent oxygenase degradation C-term-domain-containing protein [Desarmillaria tabescens]|uniref:uS12 prolyl 3,4-dihydroxylase n=1 Tax=Armillaria tabescens TaxID=1929756 RepID=A0AA39N9W5_ARMTA|nr:Oxoglutarate and iron-dependent oxygenase degradation C-term-domain-containing protein [Desarmillaria tabescens]KAK0461659.1 Oxoglutarate and iron-dependent oxygenase degradation C-term-domain-containing protein [Desarmillaria tabescens]
MARPRSPSADQSDTVSLLKRLKTQHPNNGTAAGDPVAAFATDLFDHANISRLNTSYLESTPFHYAMVEKLFQDDLLKNVKDECLSELSFTEKETDIYKVNQTGDLASLNYLTSSQISLLPNLLRLRDALYSYEFRSFLRTVTGCGPLSGKKQDMSVNSYTKGCHLLNHDDVIGSRRVSYILYMPLPNYQLWQKDWGGALELYPVKEAGDGNLEPLPVPAKMIPPSWNQFIFFEVQPGRSFHSVEEVVVGGEGEDGRERLSISGWFHAAQEGEEGYDPERLTAEGKSSREQLASTSTVFRPYTDTPTSSPLPDGLPQLTDQPLSEEHISFLSEYLNPVYLQSRTMKALASRFVEESSLELHSFLKNDLAEALEPRLRDLDATDGLGPERMGRVPPHSSGINLPASSNPTTHMPHGATNGKAPLVAESNSAWTVKGPPHKWRYCTLLPPSPSAPVTSVTPLSAHPSPSEILRALQDELFPSQALRAWMASVTKLLPLRHNVEARRFRPGLDYTLATSEENEARLDVVLGLTPEALESEDDDMRGRVGKGRGKELRGWAAGQWGAWECYMAPHNEEDDPAVYRAGTYKKSAVLNGTAWTVDSSGNGNGSTNGGSAAATASGNGGHSPSDGSPNGKHSSPDPIPMDADEAGPPEDEEDDDEEDSTLLTVQPGFNRLLLVLRDERVMRFVKYVSAAADGSRWDVCGEYEVGVVQEEAEMEEAQ